MARVPLASVRRVRKLEARESEPSQSYLSTAVLGRPRSVVELDRPIAVRGVYGLRRTVDKIGATVDDEAGFERALS